MSLQIEHRSSTPRGRGRGLLSLPLALSALLATSGALAQQREPFALDRFQPAPAGQPFFGVPGPDVLGHADISMMVLGEYARNPLVLSRTSSASQTEQPAGAVVSDQLFIHIGASISLWSRLSLSADLPIAVVSTGDAPKPPGTTAFVSPSGASAGDLRADARVRIFGESGGPFQIGLGGYLWLPTGSDTSFTGEGTVRGSPLLLLGGKAGPIVWNASSGVMFRNSARFAGTETGYELTYSAGVAAVLLGGKLQVGPEMYGSAVLTGSGALAKETTNLEMVLGLKYRNGPWMVGAALGPGITSGVGTPSVRAILSAGLNLGDRDSDADGIVNRVDACPDVKGVVQYKGCPAPAQDRDKDSVLDDVDACPDTPGLASEDARLHGCADRDHDTFFDPVDACPDEPGVKSDDPKKNGCPAAAEKGDRDHDTILDDDDACPDTPGTKSEDPKKNGCPKDTDGDGIADEKDACPDVKGAEDPDPKKNGCPKDTDGDSILDPEDACPNEKGVADPDPTKHGCPTKVRVTKDEVVILQPVQFQIGSDRILKASDDVLQQVTNVLKEHPEIKKLMIEGHTDSRGGKALNASLSGRRAASVVKWLVAHGIEKSQLDSMGFGQEKPIADNATDEGRRANRRVQFKIIESTRTQK